MLESTSSQKHPESDNLYCEKIDLNEPEPREIGSGLQKFISIEQMSGFVIVFANLKPRKLGGFNSNGMVLCASDKQQSKFEIARPAEGSLVGQRVKLEGHQQKMGDQKLQVLKPKKKILEKTIKGFRTDNQGYACWNGVRMKTSKGYILTQMPNCKLS